MENKQIKELMAAMGRTGTLKLLIKKEGFELQIERSESGAYKTLDSALEFFDEGPSKSELALKRATTALARAASSEMAGSLAQTETKKEKEDMASQYVTSPMVGTFYATPSPEDPPFVKVGDKIDKNSVVCIIEAMKVMNEVKAQVAGTVVEVLVESGHPVEFGTKLFKIS